MRAQIVSRGFSPIPFTAFGSDINNVPEGMLVLDDGVVNICRYVVNLSGPDTISYIPINSDLKTIDWSFKFLFLDNNLTATVDTRILTFTASAMSNLIVLAKANGYLGIVLRNDGVSNIASTNINLNHSDGKWHIMEIEKIGSTLTLKSDLGNSSISTNLWTGTGFTGVSIFDNGVEVRPLSVCNIYSTINSSNLDFIPCDELSGTILNNIITPDRFANLSDPTAHLKALVPVSIL